jgi:hypothetical protein
MQANTTWSDERMDEFARRTEEFAERTEENFREVRQEIRQVETGLRTEMNYRFATLEGKIEQRFNILFGAMATGFVAAVVQHLIG